jgi:hypothetical protein
MTTEIQAALSALEQLSSSTSTSSSGPLNNLLETHFIQAKERILAGDNPKAVITDLQKNVVKAKKDVEKGLKAWYGALGNVGKAIDTVSKKAQACINILARPTITLRCSLRMRRRML